MANNKNWGPIPFRFNPQWANQTDFLGIVSESWSHLVTGSPFYVWEEKLRRLKKTLKSWAKAIPFPSDQKIHAAHELESHQAALENKIVDAKDIQTEIALQSKLHNACKIESDWWKLKARSNWLIEGDRNSRYFHKQAAARNNINCVKEIHTQDRIISSHEEIKKEATRHFSGLFKA